MNKRVFSDGRETLSRDGFWFQKNTSSNIIGVLLCGAFFICGCVTGTVAAKFVSEDDVLYGYISSIVSALDSTGSTNDFIVSFFASVKYHLLAVFLGFSVLGILCLPALSAVRGFFLCFSIASVVRAFAGKGGVLLALSIFGFSSITMVPCFFILTVQSFSSSMVLFKAVAGSQRQCCVSPFGKQFFLRTAVCMLMLILFSLIDTFLISRLIKFTLSRIV